MEIKNHQKINHLSQIKKKKKILGNIIVLSKIFLKINLKFYSNVTTHNQTYE